MRWYKIKPKKGLKDKPVYVYAKKGAACVKVLMGQPMRVADYKERQWMQERYEIIGPVDDKLNASLDDKWEVYFSH